MRVHRIRGLIGSTYLIESDSLFMVDAGFVGHAHGVVRKIRSIGRRLEELKLVLVTHAHLDHFGGLSELKELCDFDIACHRLSAERVGAASKDVSPGQVAWAKAVVALAHVSLPRLTFKGATPTMSLEDGDRLHDYGLPGTVLHTPGHTDGCITLLLDDGTAFTGDLVMGKGGVRWAPRKPAMAVSLENAYASWRRLLGAGAKTILPAHAGSFAVDELTALLCRAGVPPAEGARA